MAVSAQKAQIGVLYVSYFGLSPDPAELSYWVGQLNSGVPLLNIANAFTTQPVALAL
jgi:hypothetical protein